MSRISRLPAGYKNRVAMAVTELKHIISDLNSQELKEEEIANKLMQHVIISNIYMRKPGIVAYDFDYKILGAHISYSMTTRMLSLDSSCTVFIEGTEDFIDNYSLKAY